MINRFGIKVSSSAALLLTILALHYSSGFYPSKILCTLPSSYSTPSYSLPALSEPYTYLSHGRQSFVFESADGQSVIKLFNQAYFQKKWYHVFFLSSHLRQKLDKKLALRQTFYQESYPLAAKEFPEDTGILYLHLDASTSLPSIHLIDPSGRPLTLDLNQCAFVIQKKAVPYLPHLQKVATQEGLPGLIREIDQWLAFCSKRIEQNVIDYDHDIWNNVGVLDGKILFIDPGKFQRSPSPLDQDALQLEWWKATHRLYKWLLTNNPEAARYLVSKTHALCVLDTNTTK